MIPPLFLLLPAVIVAGSQFFADAASQSDWRDLDHKVEGRLFKGVPFARPCFEQGFNSTNCQAVRASYLDEESRSNVSGAYIQTQWESCQTTNDQCLLNYLDVNDVSPTLPPNKCRIGSIPAYFIDVRTPGDVSAAFAFSRKTKIPLVIKNTGHDYKGRSSAPKSLALWTHNLKNISYSTAFIPQGCKKATPGVTLGAGVQWGEAYAFAETHNITLVGGSDKNVGVVGGWLQGGGHSALSNTMGLGVDRVLEYKLVTPDGQLRTASACVNSELFFALRGGGGGTFGVVLEATVRPAERVTLQTLILTFPTAASASETGTGGGTGNGTGSGNGTGGGNGTRNGHTREMWGILADNAERWAVEGWGGISNAGTVVMINPGLTPNTTEGLDQAGRKSWTERSMAPLIEFAAKLQKEGVQISVLEFGSWGTFFEAFTSDNLAAVGYNLALASRLISRSTFETPVKRAELVSGLITAEAATPGLIILITAPASFPLEKSTTPFAGTSVTEAWRTSLYHITVISAWNWDAGVKEKKEHYRKVGESIDNLRRITPDAAYLNEADVYEPNYEVSFWGKNYPELLRIKKKYDPEHLLDCWQCVGWNPRSPRFACYL